MTTATIGAATLTDNWLNDVVDSAKARIPFYGDHLAGIDGSDLALLPSFHKHMTAGYGSFPLSASGASGAFRVAATSGTTGDRLLLAFDQTDCDRVATWLQMVGQQVGLGSDDVLVNTHCYGLWVGGPVLDLLAHQTGACLVPLGPGSPAAALHMLNGSIGTAISATPSYLRRLIEAAEAAGIDLTNSPLRLGFIGAEVAEEALRDKLRSRLPEDFRWIELYGLTETFGPSVAFAPDPVVPELTLNTRDFAVEVLDLASDEPVAAGDVGELTVTSRHSTSRSPLLRYRTRDLVRVAAGDPSAPTRISRILGRADDAVKVGGVLVYPTALAQIITEVLPATAEWRGLLRRSSSEHQMTIEAEGSVEDCQAVEQAFHDRLGLEVTVIPADPVSLKRSLHKTQRIVTELVADDRDFSARGRTACG